MQTRTVFVVVVSLLVAPLLLLDCYSSEAPPLQASGAPEPTAAPPPADAARPMMSCTRRKPWEGPGVTGYAVDDGKTLLFSKDRYYEVSLDNLTWGTTGQLATRWASAPLVAGQRPWEAEGVTAVFNDKGSGTEVIISQFRYWMRSGSNWVDSGNLAELWGGTMDAGPPSFDGSRPWEGAGVTATYFTGDQSAFGAVSQDKVWVRITSAPDPKKWRWVAGTLLEDIGLKDTPTIDGKHFYSAPPGVTAAWTHGASLYFASTDKLWIFDGMAWTQGHLKDLPGWSSAPAGGCDP